MQDLTFTIWTSHGEYQHYATVKVPSGLTDIEAWEKIQQASPYTPNATYDERSASIKQVVEYVAAARREPVTNPYEQFNPAHDMYFPGWSWTWIKVEPPAEPETITFKVTRGSTLEKLILTMREHDCTVRDAMRIIEEEQKGLSLTEIAAKIRADVKTAIKEGLLPERWKYSVTKRSGGRAIQITVKNCADAWVPCPGYQIGSRHDYPDGSWSATGCKDPWCKAKGDPAYAHAAHEHNVLGEEALAAQITLERIHGAYNHDGYFDVNYYGGVSFEGGW